MNAAAGPAETASRLRRTKASVDNRWTLAVDALLRQNVAPRTTPFSSSRTGAADDFMADLALAGWRVEATIR